MKDYAKGIGVLHNPIIEKIKEEVAKENGFKNWTSIVMDSLMGGSKVIILNCCEEVAKRCLEYKK